MEMINETAIEPHSWHSPLKGWQRTWSGWIVALFAITTFVFALGQIYEWGDLKQISTTSDAIQALISIASFILAWKVKKHPAIDAETKKAWRIVTLSYFSYSFGHTIWFYYSSVLGIEPFPSLADVGFLGMYPLLLWALLSFPTEKKAESEKLKFTLDTAIVMIGGATVIWHFIVQPTLAGIKDDEWLNPLLNLLYTVGDLVLMLGITTVLLRRAAKINRNALMIIIGGIVNMFFADLGFAYFTLQGTYYSGHWVDNFFITAMLLFLFASFYQTRLLTQTVENNEVIEETQVIDNSFSYLPYFAVAIGYSLLVYVSYPYWSEPIGYVIFAALALTLLVVIRQITAVKENVRLLAEKGARQSELRFRSLIQNSSDLITILDFDSTIIYESPSVRNVLGYEDHELIGKKSASLLHADDFGKRKNAFEKLLASPNSIICEEFRFLHKDGSYRVLESFVRLVDEEDNNLKGILINSRDITERKLADKKLRVYTDKLQLSNRELQDFAFVASHDLQEPLRKVQAFGDRLKIKHAESLNEEGNDYLERMQNAAKRMQTLIDDLLSFSRVTSKAQPFKSVDLAKTVNGVLSDLEVKIEETNAKIATENLPVIEADTTQMQQLLQNLISNSLKFCLHDVVPIIRVYGITDDNDPESCKIIVEDNGIGFEEKYLDKIFTVFQRLHGRTKYEGSGIGLAVCRKIVERHNGTITAESSPNKGTKFIVTLPLKQQNKGDIDESNESLTNNIIS